MDYFSVVEDRVYGLVRGGLDILGHNNNEVVFSYYDIPEPKNSYCAIALLEVNQFGESDYSSLLNGSTEEFSTVTHFETLVQLSFIGDESNSMATKFDLALRSDHRVLDIMGYNRVKVLNKSNLRRSPLLRETGWVNGWNLDMRMTFSVHTKYKFDWVEYIGINGETIKIPYGTGNN